MLLGYLQAATFASPVVLFSVVVLLEMEVFAWRIILPSIPPIPFTDILVCPLHEFWCHPFPSGKLKGERAGGGGVTCIKGLGLPRLHSRVNQHFTCSTKSCCLLCGYCLMPNKQGYFQAQGITQRLASLNWLHVSCCRYQLATYLSSHKRECDSEGTHKVHVVFDGRLELL